MALLSFNLGVELGQLAFVAALLPVCYALRERLFYQRAVLQVGSLAIAVVATGWLIERALDYRLLPI